ncbi:3-oxoacyl-[acyl-carrier-protein] reductase FabG [Coccomyxa sp. Obi]|nr:3-oxoacyl-[acyl-carrier-protein] reductase FabG [Coccomyxa sp. Obi]
MARTRGSADSHYKSLEGKKVLITGGSAGIGKAAAIAFSNNGAIVTITGRRQERLDAVVSQLKQGHSVVADLLKVSDCTRTIEEAVAKMGGLDILVNSGGVWTDAMLSEPLGEKAFLDGLTMHVITVARLIEEAIPHLSKNKNGAVVNLSSLSAIQVNPDSAAYNVSKAAQDHLTKTLARKYTKLGVRINSVNPGFVDTEVFDVLVEATGRTKAELHDWAKSENELHEICTAEEIAGPILFLASDAASFISGVHIPIAGAAQVQLEIEDPSIYFADKK